MERRLRQCSLANLSPEGRSMVQAKSQPDKSPDPADTDETDDGPAGLVEPLEGKPRPGPTQQKSGTRGG